MKLTVYLATVAVVLLGFLATCRPNWIDHAGLNTSEGLSNSLSYSIQFHPSDATKEARFTATLTNVSPYRLVIQLNPKKFHAGFAVRSRTGREYVIFDKEYRGMMLTATWSEPLTVLAPANSVTWTVPLASLVDEHNALVTEDSLSECTVSSGMIMAIVPKLMIATSYTDGNATQISESIQIPNKPHKMDVRSGTHGIDRVVNPSLSRSRSPDSERSAT